MDEHEQSTIRIAVRPEEMRLERRAIGRWEWEGGSTSVAQASSDDRQEPDVRFGPGDARADFSTADQM